MSKSKEQLWEEWVATRPSTIQELCRKFPPFRMYIMKNTGHMVSIVSYDEHKEGEHTLTVYVGKKDNSSVLFSRRVFGVKPENLVEIPNVS